MRTVGKSLCVGAIVVVVIVAAAAAARLAVQLGQLTRVKHADHLARWPLFLVAHLIKTQGAQRRQPLFKERV